MNKNEPNLARRSGPGVAIGLALSLVATHGALRAQKTPLPDAADVIDRHVAAFASKAALAAIHNRVAELRVVHEGMDLEDVVFDYYAKPDKRYVRIESEVFGVIEQGFDGKFAWRLTEEQGPVVEREGTGSRLGPESVFERLLDWRELYAKAECTGLEKVGDRLCHRVVLTPLVGEPETMFFDAKTHLLARTRTVMIRAGIPPAPLESTMSDYRRIDGIMIPHRIHQVSHACGTERAMTFVTKSVKHNVELPKDRFELPPAVRAGIADGSAYASGCDANGKPACGDPGAKTDAIPPRGGKSGKKDR